MELENKWIEKIFGEVKAAHPLDTVFKIAIPVSSRFNLGGNMRYVQRRHVVIRLNANNRVLCFYLAIEALVFMSQAVIITKRYERGQFERAGNVRCYSARLIDCVSDFILHYSRVFAMNHKDRLLDQNVFDVICKDWKRVQPKACLKLVALRVNRAGVLIGRKIVTPPFNDNRLLEF